MSTEKTQFPPCAGEFKGDGCGLFETYAKAQVLFITTDTDDERNRLLADPDSLRARLYADFVAAGHCVLMREIASQKSRPPLPEGVASIVRLSDIEFAGCPPAIEARAGGSHRLFSPDMMMHLIDGPRPVGPRPDANISALYDHQDPAYRNRIRSHRQVVQGEDVDMSSRVISGGALLFYFHDSDSVDRVDELFKNRIYEVGRDDLGSEEWETREWAAWLQIIVGLQQFSRLDDEDFAQAIQMMLVNGFDSSLEHAKSVGRQSYRQLTILMADEVAKRPADCAEGVLNAIAAISAKLVELIAVKYGLEKGSLAREFSGVEETELQAGQTRLRLVR